MNFTSSPFERMMKEVPHPGWDNDDPYELPPRTQFSMLNRKQILFQYRYCNVKNLKIYLYQICRNSLIVYNDRAVRLLRKEC